MIIVRLELLFYVEIEKKNVCCLFIALSSHILSYCLITKVALKFCITHKNISTKKFLLNLELNPQPLFPCQMWKGGEHGIRVTSHVEICQINCLFIIQEKGEEFSILSIS